MDIDHPVGAGLVKKLLLGFICSSAKTKLYLRTCQVVDARQDSVDKSKDVVFGHSSTVSQMFYCELVNVASLPKLYFLHPHHNMFKLEYVR